MRISSTYRNILLALLLVVGSVAAQAQAPSGYMGKRLIVGAQLNTFGAWVMPNANNEIGITSFNTQKQFTLEWVTSRTASVGLTYRHYKTTAEFIETPVEYNVTNSWGGVNTCSITPNSNAPMWTNHYGIYTKFNTSKEIAPLGSYFLFGLERLRWRVQPDPDTFDHQFVSLGNECTETNPTMVHEPRMHGTMFTMAIGKQRIFFDRLVFNYGLQMSWVFGANTIIDPLSGIPFAERETETYYIEALSRSRLFSHNFINFSIGLGWLAY